MKCRHCSAALSHVVVDLGHQPPSNAYLEPEHLERPEVTFPMKVFACHQCGLVQLPAHAGADDLFTPEYAYFSSISKSWLEHAKRYVDAMATRFDLNEESLVVELASNDGYLLQYVKARKIPCLGIEPTHSTAVASREKGIETIEEFFGVDLATRLVAERGRADLIAGNNVLAHVPDINDFVKGIQIMLAPDGVTTLEFPHLLNLVEGLQFDTIYHEHYSYLSLHAVKSVFEMAGLDVFDVEEIPTHGGSLRVFGKQAGYDGYELSQTVSDVLEREIAGGLTGTDVYSDFQSRCETVKDDLLKFLLDAKANGKTVAAYGAAAKGNTLMNFAGIRPDLVRFVCDAAPSKQGRFMPGNHIPILAPNALSEYKPDYVLILPWNIRDEIVSTQGHIAEWGGRFAVAVPEMTVIDGGHS